MISGPSRRRWLQAGDAHRHPQKVPIAFFSIDTDFFFGYFFFTDHPYPLLTLQKSVEVKSLGRRAREIIVISSWIAKSDYISSHFILHSAIPVIRIFNFCLGSWIIEPSLHQSDFSCSVGLQLFSCTEQLKFSSSVELKFQKITKIILSLDFVGVISSYSQISMLWLYSSKLQCLSIKLTRNPKVEWFSEFRNFSCSVVLTNWTSVVQLYWRTELQLFSTTEQLRSNWTTEVGLTQWRLDNSKSKAKTKNPNHWNCGMTYEVRVYGILLADFQTSGNAF